MKKDNVLEKPNEGDELKPKILVVDDVKEMRFLLKSILESAGYVAVEVENGEDAIAALRESADFDLVLLDVGLPDLSGFKVAEIVKNDKSISHIKICFVTGDGEFSSLQEAGKLGAVGYVVKPFRPQIVLEKVELILKS